MNTKKRILIYTAEKYSLNVQFFLGKMKKYVQKIVFFGSNQDFLEYKDIENFYASIEDAINDNKDFDEYIIANDMFYGPFFDMELIFKKMEKVSFWSIDDVFFKNKSFLVFKKDNLDTNPIYCFSNPFDFDINILKNRLPFLHNNFLKQGAYDFCNLKLKNIYSYLKQNKEYDFDIILQDFISRNDYKLFNEAFCADYILSTSTLNDKVKNKSKSAVVMYIYPENLIDYCYEYALNIPKEIDICIVTTELLIQEKIKKIFKNIKNKIIYRNQQNRGRDNTALLVTCKDLFCKYDYMCFVHAKESNQNKITNNEFRNHCFDSLLYNSIYIKNIISEFKKNKKLGIISPYPPEFAPYRVIGNEWLHNYDNAVEFVKSRLNIDFDLSKDNILFAFGNMFWFRTAAMTTLLSSNLSFEDFPMEPLDKVDGMLTHTIERIVPTLAKNDGYYSVYSLPDVKASSYINVLITSLKETKMEIE